MYEHICGRYCKTVVLFGLSVLYIFSANSPVITAVHYRKNQARKVVCIPAPTTAGSRPTGEVVPSDLWAWRKYGQKPIKGSPHPRYVCMHIMIKLHALLLQ